MSEYNFAEPAPLFKLLIPTREKMDSLRGHLKNDYLYLTDEFRNDMAVEGIIYRMFSSPAAIYYEIGDWGGVAGFRDIFPGKSAHCTFKFWGKELWGRDIARQMKTVLEMFENHFKLVRVESETADPRIEKLARMFGFQREGVKRKGFRWDGEFRDMILLGRVKEG